MYQNDKIVIFDWGGVVESHAENEYNCYLQKINLISEITKNRIEKESIIKKWIECNNDENGKSIGEVCEAKDVLKWFDRIKNMFDLHCTFSEFEELYEKYGDKIYYYKDVVEFSRSLKDKCKIGILSNLSKLDHSRIDKHYNLSKFDYVWLSYELNCKKPDPKIYEIVENECNILPENILFVDDKTENIDMAKQRGWKTCQAKGKELEKMKTYVKAFLNSNLYN